MSKPKNQSYRNYEQNGYPVLRLGYANVILLGRWDGLSNALFSLHNNSTFWVKYDMGDSDEVIESYTLLDGTLEMEYEGMRRIIEIGETIDASKYENIISFYGETEAEILIKMNFEKFEPSFFESKLLQKEADVIEEIDGYTYMHCNRIKDYSLEVWNYLKLPVESLSRLRWGAYFHDIGKRVIPIEILNKPGKLTSEEWEIMKTHTTEGAEIMRNHSVKWLEDSAFIVEQHHERYDGKGYPYGLRGEEITLEASIVSVVDAFDAMTTDRVYKKALSIKEAVKELEKGKGTQFKPVVVDALIDILKNKQFRW
ncbi:HD-GYP domain-containing protein [Psychrobacillus glaciei]|uniref:HD-GYP domain-containing protein n=1 Tax=Psychrobacillus glaciei TaxID=2283160 RepID=A0A5J6ST14_9BACI|nr:HD-GYP domain-containing protein [Psychrobacillus glaciei]QFG00583.1 HD-GYP domain-containing protein [Psychrobacillus glaciei]